MVFTKNEALEIMNEWGTAMIPFLFIIDYEMKAIQLYRLDEPLPENICYSFHGEPLHDRNGSTGDFIFRKYPIPFAEYEAAFSHIQNHIQAGNTFLANLTCSTKLETSLTLRQMYEFSHAKYKILSDNQFVCFSPETFVTIRNGIITTNPMKGTINAELPDAEKLIMESPKETAEHYTVVDLLRNDISIVAEEVTVKRFRYIDRILSHTGCILQVSSEITGKLHSDYNCHLGSIMFDMLPAGSVTGAPKKRTTALIREVEQKDRGYYTGVCGVFDGKNIDSAVMIRFVEMQNGTMHFRSGGGITFMSNAHEEYDELINKIYVPIV